jgi:Family of unknown function (DUF6263)
VTSYRTLRPLLGLAILMIPAAAWADQPIASLPRLDLEPMRAPVVKETLSTPQTLQLAFRGRRLICVPLPACTPSQPFMPYATPEVSFLPNLEKGNDYYSSITSDTEQLMKVMGQEITQTQTETFIMRWRAEGKNREGYWVLDGKILAVKLKINIGGNLMEYDSTAVNTAPNPLADFLKSLVGGEIRYLVRPDGTIAKVEGRDRLLKAPGNPQLEPLLKSIVSDDALKRIGSPLLEFRPPFPVAAGESWKRGSLLDMAADSFRRSGLRGRCLEDREYTYQGKSGSLEKIAVRINLNYQPPEEKLGLPYNIKSADLKSTGGTGKSSLTPPEDAWWKRPCG